MIGHRTIKTAIGATVAMLIASYFQLEYYTAAGIVTILSIQNTKRQSVQIAIARFLASLLALTLASILFYSFGYSAIVFGVFLLFFIPLTNLFKVSEGIVVSSVLVTHLLVEESISFSLLVNEVMLMTIGVAVALVINLYMPSLESDFKNYQETLEIKMKQIFINMSNSLQGGYVSIYEQRYYTELESLLTEMEQISLKISENKLFRNDTYYKDYVAMRKKQFEYMKRLREPFEKLTISYEQTIMLSIFTQQVALSIYEENNASLLLTRLQTLLDVFRKMELPTTRIEFENRAVLFYFMRDLEKFLQVKNQFIEVRKK